MNFSELREALTARGLDPLSVTCSDYDDVDTVSRAVSDRWVLRHRDDAWEVGGVERGRFLLDSRFQSEAAACARLAEILLVPRHGRELSPAEKAESATADRHNAENFARMLAQQKPKS